MENNKITMFQAGIIFTVSVATFILFSFLNPFENFYTAGVFGEVIPILLPAVLGLLIFKKSLKINLKMHKLRLTDGILIVLLTLLVMPLNMLLNAFNMWLVEIIFGQNMMVDIPVPETGTELLVSILVIGVVAAVCEEVLFRGVLQSSFERLGKAGMFLLVSLLFAAFHFSIEQFFGVFALSIVITYVVYRTNSIFAGMLAHFINNAAALVISYFAAKIPESVLEGSEAAGEFPGWMQVAVIAVVIIIFTATAAAVLFAFHRGTKETRIEMPETRQMKTRDAASFIPGLIIMGVMFIATIIGYILMPTVNF